MAYYVTDDEFAFVFRDHPAAAAEMWSPVDDAWVENAASFWTSMWDNLQPITEAQALRIIDAKRRAISRAS